MSTTLELYAGVDTTTESVDTFRFDQCRVAEGAGESVVDGSFTVADDYRSGSRFSTGTLVRTWDDFSLQGAAGDTLDIDGSTTASYLSSDMSDYSRTVDLPRYAERSSSGLVERLDEASLSLRVDDRSDGLFEGYRLDVSGTVTSAATGGAGVVVDTVTTLARYRRTDGYLEDEIIRPFDGELSLRAEDGRTVTLVARDTDTDALFVDRSFTGTDGTSRTAKNVPFAVLTTVAPVDVGN